MTKPAAAVEAADRLVAALGNPQALGHPVSRLRRIETHISWIILTGEFAYKIKKPVSFGFVDFSTLEKRRFYCEEELRLNRRFAADIYLELVPIRGSIEHPRMHGDGDPIEYAIKMREFSQRDLLSALAADGRLDAAVIDHLADSLSEIHRACAPASADSEFGTARSVSHWSEENLIQISRSIPPDSLPPAFRRLEEWYRREDAIGAVIEDRREQGQVRECHGDLHLGNMVLLDGRITLFDCLEFNPELRWIDTISEMAFVAMDIQARGFAGLGWRFINRYLQASGDYRGVAVLRYYLVYRALVRAKVEALRSAEDAASASRYKASIDYIELAHRWAEDRRPGIILMHGLSGSGKSTVAARLVEELGAIQIRSDIERKRLHGLDADARSNSAPGGGIYTAEASAATYDRLRRLAKFIIDAGFCVIVDAAFLHTEERARLLGLEIEGRCNRLILHCDAPPGELRRRILARTDDPSEANLDVLERQLRSVEAITPQERQQADVFTLTAESPVDLQLETIRRQLAR